MTEILCRWLNSELDVSKKVDTSNFAESCATGYLIGEVLKKHQLQDDFESFSQNSTADSRLNNFTRLEPTLHLLEVPFDTNMARDIMTEKPGVATRLMYQLYIALNNKKKADLTGVAMETMRPRAPVKLESMERGPYKERLKILTPRQTDLNLDQLVERFRERKRQHLDVEFRTKFEMEEQQRQWQQEMRQKELEKGAQLRRDRTEMTARIKAATLEIPKPPPNKTLKAITFRKELTKKKEAEETQKQIAEFEHQLSRSLADAEEDKDADAEVAAYLNKKQTQTEKPSQTVIQPSKQSTVNDEYINKIRKRLQEDGVARKEREKRRRKVLVDQLKAHETQEEARREELLVTRLMRQSQQERRIATQLLQLRHEKAVIQQNRILREQQYEERRQKDFHEALDREAELARLAKLEYIEQTKRDKEIHDKITKERAAAKYRKHYNTCYDILNDIVDFSCKVGKYRELTAKLLPPKLMREWKLLFTSGKPLYEPTTVQQSAEETSTGPAGDSATEIERQTILDEGDFMEYKNMVGEWQPPEDCEITGPPGNNAVLGHVLARLFGIVSPPTPPPDAPEMPLFPVKACFLGKAFAGKSSVANKIAQEHGLEVLNIDVLVREAIDAHKAGEVIEIPADPSQLEATHDVEGSKLKVTISLDSVGEGKEIDTTSSQDNVKVGPPTADLLNAGKSDEKADDEKSISSRVTEGDLEEGKKKGGRSAKSSSKGTATPRSKLGRLANRYVRKGQPIKDELLVEIMIEAVKRVRDQQGWIMDGFPSTITQAKLLEKALTGYDPNAKPSKEKLKKSRLAPDPQPAKDPPPPVSGIDVVVLLDIPNEMAMRRAAGRTHGNQTGQEYQQEFKPPPEGSATGVGKQEKVVAAKDTAHDQEQIQHRLTGFADSWKKLDKWYTGFGILQKLNVSQDKDEAYDRVHNMMLDTRDKIQKAKEDALKPPEPEAKPASDSVEPSDGQSTQLTEGLESIATQVGDPQGVGDIPATQGSSPRGSRAGSAKKRGGSAKRKGSPDKSPKRGKSPKGKRSESGSPKRASSRPGSPKRKKSPKRRTPTPEPEPEPAPAESTGPPPPQPGSEDWVWVNEPVDESLAQALAPHWDNTESTYISGCKHVFHNIRLEREDIYHYFHTIKVNFEDYLRRPDTKQEFLAAWQQDYNEIAEDMRDDEETKSELHQRVMDLKEQLWEISDNRKVEAENERQSVMEEGWLEDRLGLLTNHYLTLMQSETDRYQDTLRLLKDYYQGMEGKIPEEFDPGFVRIPLIDLATPLERPPSELKSPSESNTRAVTPTAPTPSAKGRKGKEAVEELKLEDDDEEKPKIPLVPRRPRSTEGFFPIQTPAGNKPEKGSKSRAGKKDKQKEPVPTASVEETHESPIPPSDPDEKLIHDAYTFGIMKVSEMTAAELAAKEAEDEAEKQNASVDKDKDKGKKAGKKRSKSKSPSGKKSPGGKKSPKKGKKAATPTPPPTPPPVEYTPEEQARRDLKDKMKQEYMAAIIHEETGLKSRMELIKIHTIDVLQSLKSKAEGAYKDMDDWLGARFQSEMTSIDTVCGVLGQCIEKREKVKPELVSFQNEFQVNKEVKVFRTPSPPRRPSPIEIATPETFTVDQIKLLHDQFKNSAPTGFISSRGFIDILSDLTALTHGMEALPDQWMKLTAPQFEHLASSLSPDSEYIDWRTFLLQTAQPWPQPSQAQLLETLQKFYDIDVFNTGMINREQFQQVELWYTAESRLPTPDDPSAPMPYNRTAHIQTSFFDIFADENCAPPMLDYKDFLLYFSIAPSAMNGFFRALSVAANRHMPRPKGPEEPELDEEQVETLKETVETWKGEDIQVASVKEPTISFIGPLEEQIPAIALNATVPLGSLVQVFHHGQPTLGDSHRFSVTSDPEDTFSQERLAGVYRELGNEDLDPVPFFTLIEHPIILDCLSMCHRYKAADLTAIFASASAHQPPVDNDAQSIMS